MTALRALRGLLPLALVLLAWELVGDPGSPTLPAPSAWWEAGRAAERSGTLWPAVGTTMALFGQGLAAATALGVALGIALGSSRPLARGLGPVLELLRTTPAVAIVPAAILLFGADGSTGVGVVVFGSLWPILLGTAAARRALPPLRLELAGTLRLTWWERMRKVVLPSVLPQILTGVRVAAPIAFIVALLVDFLLSTGGMGMLLVEFQQAFDAAGAFAVLAVIGAAGCVISAVLGGAERLALRRWPV